MHFRNNRKTINTHQQSKPCPYHSRVVSVSDLTASVAAPAAPAADGYQHSRKSKSISIQKQQDKTSKIRLPKLLKNSNMMKKQALTNMKSDNKNVDMMEMQMMKIDSEYVGYGERIKTDFNYYEDMKLSDEGWPKHPNYQKLHDARNQDMLWKAQKKVKQIYLDQYANVKQELDIIQKINQRYNIIRNIEEDKKKLKHILKQITTKKVYIDDNDNDNDNHHHHHRDLSEQDN